MREKIQISTDDLEFEAELADNLISRMKGLSFRSSGKMLFVFPRETRAKIDMMFLSKPLYLYFLNSKKEVIEVQRAELWTYDPRTWKFYSPDQRYRYLLESFENLKIKEGEDLNF
ncbi:hypothetical protein GLU60_00985 [Nanohaloarchaea archaeon H01]|nr:hypothetical protein [Nanohaloarchaea archaeon H01]